MKTENGDIEFGKKIKYKAQQGKRKWEMLTDDDLLFVYYQLPIYAKQWRDTMPKFKEDELLKLFPEAKKVIPEKIAEWNESVGKLYKVIKSELVKIRLTHTDNFVQQIYRELLKLTLGKELLKMKGHITRLRRIQSLSENRQPQKGWINDADIQRAKAVPIESLVNMGLRKSGRSLIGLCPFHNEKTPSFHIYTDQNMCWCYGCNQGGNTIKLVMLLYGFTFIKAVKHLIK